MIGRNLKDIYKYNKIIIKKFIRMYVFSKTLPKMNWLIFNDNMKSHFDRQFVDKKFKSRIQKWKLLIDEKGFIREEYMKNVDNKGIMWQKKELIISLKIINTPLYHLLYYCLKSLILKDILIDKEGIWQ